MEELLAFHVWDDRGQDPDEQHHEIVFATDGISAMMKSESYLNRGEIGDTKAERTPEYDQFSTTQKVPKEEMIKYSWTFECDGCYRWVGEEGFCFKDEIYCEECQGKLKVVDDKVMFDE